MIRKLSIWTLLAALGIAGGALPSLHADDDRASPWVWDGIERVVAIGDVHGSYLRLLSILRGLDLIDGQHRWSGAEQHLVMVGDLLDRGAGDRPILDLMMRLESEARAAGGRVHVVLGNHEVMNLVRDLRYVARESYADFREFDQKADRATARRRYFAAHSRSGVSSNDISRAFSAAHPPGYFGRLRAFDADGEYGEWLLGLPTMVKINGLVFVHGGLTDTVAKLGLDEVNRRVTSSLLSLLSARAELEEATGRLADRRQLVDAAERLAAGEQQGSEPAAKILRLMDELPFADGGPLWYRGNAVENERLERSMIDRVLSRLDARGLVIGHTPTASGFVTSRFRGRLYRVDVGMVYGRPPVALVVEPKRVWVFDPDTLSSMPMLKEAPQGEGWARKYEELPDEKLERFLAKARFLECREVRIEDRSGEICEVARKSLQQRAVFVEVDEAPEPLADGWITRRYPHEVAAYRLDRMLGLDLVPVTVFRERAGREGSLRIWVEPAVDLRFLLEHDRMEMLDGLEQRIGEARLFVRLIGVRDQLDEAKMMIPLERRIFLGDHSKAFPVAVEVEPPPDVECAAMSPELELGLRELDLAALGPELGELLSAAQLAALLERRDAILDGCEQWAIDEAERQLQDRL